MQYMNQVMFDTHAKEYVMVSNGRCKLDHSSVEAYRKSHQTQDGILGECVYEPCEAIAIRAFVSNGDVSLYFTHRKVNANDLEEVKPEHADPFRESLSLLQSKPRKAIRGMAVLPLGRL